METALPYAGLSAQTMGQNAMSQSPPPWSSPRPAVVHHPRLPHRGRLEPGMVDAIELSLAMERAKFGGGRPELVKINGVRRQRLRSTRGHRPHRPTAPRRRGRDQGPHGPPRPGRRSSQGRGFPGIRNPNSDATADRGRSPLKRVARRRATRPSWSSSRCVAEAGAVPAPDGGQRRLFRDGSAAVLASRSGVTWTSAGSAAEGPEGQPTQARGASPGRTSWPTPSRSARRQDLLTRTRLAPLRPRAGSDRPRQRGTTAPGSPDPNGVHGPHRIT